RVITVRINPAVDQQEAEAFFARERLEIIRSNKLGFVDVRIPAGSDPVDYVERLLQLDFVDSADVNTRGEYFPIANPTDPIFQDQWHLPKINVAPSAWEITTGSTDIIVAVLDSGTDVAHEDLAKNIWINPSEDINGNGAVVPGNADHLDNADKNGIDEDGNTFIDDLVGWDFSNNNNNVRGPNFHGTHVAGIVGSSTDNGIGVAGVAGGLASTPGTLIMALGVGDNVPNSDALDDAIIYAADNGARIITMSLGVAPSPAIDAAIEYAFFEKGVFLDNAAGNSAGPVSYPATHELVVAVSSLDMSDNISAFSNRGPEIELAAPGEEIWSTQIDDNYNQGDGTSYASPQIAGVAALVLACEPRMTNKELRNILHESATDLGTPGKDDLFGFGRVDGVKALELAGCMKKPDEKPMAYKYAAKIVCGLSQDPDDLRIAQGFYATTVNIQNPNAAEASFSKKLSLSYPPEAQSPGQVIDISTDVLNEDESLKADCTEIKERIFGGEFPRPYIEGFIVIKSKRQLNVTAVYTSRSLEHKTCKRGGCCSHEVSYSKSHGCCSPHDGEKDCSPKECCEIVPGKHSSIDVEQIVERLIEDKDEPDAKADLLPIPTGPDLQPFCRRENGDLVIAIRNQGETASPPSVANVFYPLSGQTRQAATPALDVNQTADLTVEFSGVCSRTQVEICPFEIRADSAEEVDESNETNNLATGSCFVPL
ncbi:MAG: S8 family serine peptidase, partial [Pseudomonadota bacterium]